MSVRFCIKDTVSLEYYRQKSGKSGSWWSKDVGKAKLYYTKDQAQLMLLGGSERLQRGDSSRRFKVVPVLLTEMPE